MVGDTIKIRCRRMRTLDALLEAVTQHPENPVRETRPRGKNEVEIFGSER